MAVPSNPSLQQVQDEFLAPRGTGLAAFLRGGAYVPNTPANNNVPTSLPISLSQLTGAVRYTNVTASGPVGASGEVFVPAPGPAQQSVVSNTISITGAGGTGNYTYSWSHVSGDPTVNVQSPASRTTSFQAVVARNSIKAAVKRCTVSDGVTSATHDVQVSLWFHNDL